MNVSLFFRQARLGSATKSSARAFWSAAGKCNPKRKIYFPKTPHVVSYNDSRPALGLNVAAGQKDRVLVAMLRCAFARFLLVFAVCGFIAHGAAADLSAGFDAANKLYESGKFSEAAAAYEKLTESGNSSAALYFNLGNAWFKSGQFGRAIAAYRRAEQLAPRDPDIQANLRFARNQVQGPTLGTGRLEAWLGHLTVNEWTVVSASVLWVCFVLLAVGQWRPSLKATLRNYVIGLFVMAGVTCACCATAFAANRAGRDGVVVLKDAAAHNGPLDESPNNFTLHDGAEVRILDQKDDWLQVTTDAARVGWVKRGQVVTMP